ncbi:MAG: hypothetical protein ACF8OB_10885 [Phycisphaeraceae bacterium JB051]
MSKLTSSNLPRKWEKLLHQLCLILTGYMVVMTFVGTYLQYDPIPPYDTWDIKLKFLIDIIEGRHSAWYQYNFEHFYLIPRLFFLLDYLLFNCNNIFMVSCSLCLLLISALFFLRILKDSAPAGSSSFDVSMVCMLMMAMLFSWDQTDNLRSGMLIQYYPTQILMLGAFYFLHRDVQSADNKWSSFWLSIIMAVGSVCSMANGLLTLPIMCVYALVMRMPKRRIACLIMVTVITFVLYGLGYENPIHDGDPIRYFFTHPFEAYQYVMLFLGHPFHFIFGENIYSSRIAWGMGQLLVVVTLYQGYRCLKDPKKHTLQLAMICVILAIAGTAAMSAGGRLYKSVLYALVARYSVPAIYGWVCFMILLSPAWIKWLSRKRPMGLIVCFLLLMIAIPMQSKAWFPNVNKQFATRLAGLTLTLQIHDPLPLGVIYFRNNDEYPASRVLGIAKLTMDHRLSIFSREPYKTVIDQWDKPIKPVDASQTLQGQINRIQIIQEAPRFLRITGWIADPEHQHVPRLVKFLDQHNRVVGVAITGNAQPKLRQHLGSLADQAGYMGYIKTDQQGKMLTIQTDRMRSPQAMQIPILTQSLEAE